MIGNLILRSLLATILALLSSCIDCDEEYWLHADGSGHAEITYLLPTAAASVHGGESGIRKVLTSFLNRTPELTHSQCLVSSEGKHIRVHITASFDSALDLEKVVTGKSLDILPSSVSHLAGDIRTDLHGRTIDFSRTITASKAIPGAAFLPESRLAGHRLLYTLHLPAPATHSNATRVENSGRTLVWDIPLAAALKSPVTTRFQMPIPIPWALLTAVTVPLTLAFGFLIFRRRRFWNRKSSFQLKNPESP